MTTAPRAQHRVPPEVRITVAHPGSGPIELTLSYPLDPQLDELLWALHRGGVDRGVLECRMHDNDPALRDLRSDDGRVHGAWLYLRQIDDIAQPGHKRLVLCHWPRGIVRGSHDVPSRMTPEHRHRQEYIALRGQACGYAVELEKRLDNGFRPDVLISASATLAAEIQMSDIGTAAVLRRTRKSAEADATSVWFPGSKNPPWAFKAPHVETNQRDGFAPHTWTVTTGPRALEHERCRPGSQLGTCPNGRNWCGGWHWLWSPIPKLAVDDIVEQVPAGALVRLDTKTKQGVILTRPGDRQTWLGEQTSPVVHWDQRRLPDTAGHLRHASYASQALRERIETERPEVVIPAPRAAEDPHITAAGAVEPPLHRPRSCPSCGRESRAIIDGRCLACRGVAA